MIPKYRDRSVLGLGIGFTFLVAAFVLLLRRDEEERRWIALAFGMVGLVLFYWGCYCLAKGKGYSSTILLLGLVGMFALSASHVAGAALASFLLPAVVLLVLKDKCRHSR
jgi:hypothetical protein